MRLMPRDSGDRMACHKSQFRWPLSQNSAVVPKSLARRRAVSGVMPRLPLMISLMRGYETWMRPANSTCVMPSGVKVRQ